MRYLGNCFWLLLPVLLWNGLLARRLPKPYRRDEFWRDIPGWVGAGENTFRIAILILPFLMPIRMATSGQRAGFVVYGIGLALYCLAWVVQIRSPHSAWSVSRLGFLAPAFTPAIWLMGLGLIGDSLYLPVPYSCWVYIALSAAFLVFHNTHAWMVHARTFLPR
jgi:hypothetical protein